MQTVANRDLAARWSAALAAADLPATAAWLEDLRRDAARAFDAGGLPHRKVEAWKYTPLKLLESFAPLAPDPSALEQTPEPPWRADRGVTLVDGRPSGGPWQAPPGLRLLPLSESLDEFEKSLRRLFGRVSVEGAARAFTALNTVWGHQGLLIHVAAGVELDRAKACVGKLAGHGLGIGDVGDRRCAGTAFHAVALAPEQLRDGHAGGLAGEIPQRDIHHADRG